MTHSRIRFYALVGAAALASTGSALIAASSRLVWSAALHGDKPEPAKPDDVAADYFVVESPNVMGGRPVRFDVTAPENGGPHRIAFATAADMPDEPDHALRGDDGEAGFRVLCTLEHVEGTINGYAFTEDRGQFISEVLPEEVARNFASIPGYQLIEPLAPAATTDIAWGSEPKALAASGGPDEDPTTTEPQKDGPPKDEPPADTAPPGGKPERSEGEGQEGSAAGDGEGTGEAPAGEGTATPNKRKRPAPATA